MSKLFIIGIAVYCIIVAVIAAAASAQQVNCITVCNDFGYGQRQCTTSCN
jgi:hypothetical protein